MDALLTRTRQGQQSSDGYNEQHVLDCCVAGIALSLPLTAPFLACHGQPHHVMILFVVIPVRPPACRPGLILLDMFRTTDAI